MANRVLIGKRNSTDYGLYVSKAGVDVTTASDENLLFNTDAPESGLILKSGTTTVTTSTNPSGTPASPAVTSYSSYISYGTTLNYIPMVCLWDASSGTAYHGAGVQYPVRQGKRHIYIVGGRSGTTYTGYQDNNLIYTEASTSQFRVAVEEIELGTNTTYTFFYAVFAIGGSTITSVGP